MSLRDVMEFIQKLNAAGAAATPATPLKPHGLQAKPNAHAGCTPATPETPPLRNVRQVAQEMRQCEAANDPSTSAPEPQHLQRFCNVTGNAPATASTGPAPNQHGANTGPAPEQPDWRTLDAAYLAHHARCPVCIAAGRGARYGLRCGVGASLWSDYSAAVNTPGALPWQQKGKK